jgi:hypothetical protein
MRYSTLGRVRANLILFAIAFAIAEALALVVLAIIGRCKALEAEPVRLTILCVAFAAWLSVKIEARAAFARAVSEGRVAFADEARIQLAESRASDWLVQFHIESTTSAHLLQENESAVPQGTVHADSCDHS